tara:strand:+ start:823 stop:1326 length:504 start_codon:yes stop_codon:yes gene_type:complete
MLKLATLVISAAFLNVLFLPIPSHATNEQLSCLALNIFHEARGEPKLGQYAVAHVTKNRVDSKLYPASYCGVVTQGKYRTTQNGKMIPVKNMCQFSWWCDGKGDEVLPSEYPEWEAAYAVAINVFTGKHTKDPTKGALNYHADYVSPKWAKKFKKTASISRHIFYKP